MGRPKKIGDEERAQIVKHYNVGYVTQKDLARLYKVAPSTINRIIRQGNAGPKEGPKA